MRVTITSRKNELVKEFQHLSSSSSYRKEKKKFPLEGARLCSDAAESGLETVSLLYTEEAEIKYSQYLSIIRKTNPNEYLISQSVAQALSETKNPQGVFSICARPAEREDIPSAASGQHFLMLENIQDPANLGAMLRTAEAVGIKGVVLSGDCCDVFSPKALRAGMGAAFRLPVFILKNGPETIERLNKAGFQTLAAVPDSTAIPITKLDFSVPTVAVIGNEGNGLTQETIHACSERVTIPMQGRAESLNAAASAAIIMWEMMRGTEAVKNERN
ncbi:TrmH family RNA methyltransferase [Thermocaproicibacter melissae]|uniref:TrmH family RNA methyltransferase n=1 Tax=Thermocaproicibacter melissae TaxID=2966552 RepID=UPI0024B1E5C8|nr:RNA methyltransferase [Thermocaproicibacter melissae]WBY64869.1 RNA methyltransferase [Thermocaproicibacter melissae]